MKKLFTLLALACTIFAGAQNFDRQKMDSLFEVIEKNNKGMGGFAIHKEGQPVYQTNIGYSDISQNLKAESGTKYRIGSITKTFTAAIIMQLVEEGKISLDTKLSNFYPNIPNAGKITVEDLLRHQSGLYNFTNDEGFRNYLEEPKTKEELLSIFKEQQPSFEPGEKNDYSNTGYVLLSFIIEDLEKEDYAAVLNKRILAPLNLKDTYYGGKINPANAEALSYQKKKDWEPATMTDMSIPRGAGAVVSTPSDLNKFYTALFNGKLVKPESLEKMKSMNNGYGIGLFSYPFDDKKLYGHTGGIDGFQAMSVYYPAEDLAVTYTSNASDMSPNDIMLGAMSIYWGKDYTIPSFDPVLEIPAEELQKYTGTYGSEGFPLKIEIFVEDGALMGQATGQPSFPLEAYAGDKFQFTRAGLKLEFNPSEDKLTLLQGGQAFELIKE